jgi:hypothetical protein
VTYRPAPIDTLRIQLPKGLEELTELLARNAHENWARQRMADGWTFGSSRDDAKKTHSCLIPYEELPESEKVYDRATAMETIKAILALGYRITPPK